MKITLSIIALLLLTCVTSYAQNPYAVKGRVADTTEKKEMHNATIMVLNAKDSILRKFTRAATDGSFTINDLSKGKYIMMLSYPGYADYSEGFTLDSVNKTHNFGKIGMILKSRLLQDVIIKGEVTAIKIKGDTTEFNAKAYVIQPNAKVEDLLKQLPGIQVDKDGKITAQGQAVGKVLVDGEEFFGDDPTLVTKNIRADMVDKVQLYDKKSDQATFTGIDDGQKTKTINIKLKEDKKNGYFGKLDGGIGTDGYYQGQVLYNKFKAKQKFSLYGTAANTGKTGLSWEDAQKYGDGSNMQVMDNGGIYFSGGGNDLNYNGQGIPLARTGGAHFDDKWQSDKQSFNGNYKIGSLEIDGTRNTLTQNNLPNGVINSSNDQKFNNSVFRQKLDGTYQITLDTTSNLKLTFDGTFKHNKTNTTNLNVSRRGNDTLLNSSNQSVTNDADQHLFNASAFYTKKLKKKGRTLSVLVNESINDNDSKGYTKSETDYYGLTGKLDSTQVINQYKVGSTKNRVFNSNITYSEPITKFFSVIFNYGLNVNNSTSDQKSFNQSAGGSYDILDTAYSNNFRFDQLSNQVGAIFNYNRGKNVLNFGTRASDVTYKQIDGYTGDVFKRHFINWNPQLNYQFKISQQQSLRFNYNGNTQQPSITQIQPIKNNNNPLYITLGNPDLKPSFSNNLNFGYNSYKVLSGQNIYINGNYSFTSDPIVNNTTTDITSGKVVSESFNLSNQTPHSFSIYGGAGRKIKGPEIYIGLNGSVNSNVSYNMVNNALNTNTSATYSGGININKYKENKYDFYLNFGPRYIVSESSLNNATNNNGRGFNSYGYFNYYFPGKIQVSTDIDYQYTGKTPTYNQDIYKTNWNASLIKSFLKQSNLKISLTANDILNQNIGFNRTSNGSMITQNTYTTIRRYFMFSISYDFNKMGGITAAK